MPKVSQTISNAEGEGAGAASQGVGTTRTYRHLKVQKEHTMQSRIINANRLQVTLALLATLLGAGRLPSARGQAVPVTNITTTVVTTTRAVAPTGTNTTVTTNITTTTSPPPSHWDTTASAGLTLTRGNSRTLLMTLGLETKRKWEKDDASFAINGGYGTDNEVVNANYLNGFGQYNHNFTDRFYGGLRLDAAYDGIARLDYRVTFSPLAGYYLIKAPKTGLSFEVGPSVVTEKYVDGDPDTYAGVRFAERFDQKLSATTKLWETFSYVPRVDEWTEKYVMTAEVGIDAAITKRWSLRVVLQDVYDSQPAQGRESNDVRLVAGTAYKF